MKTPNNQSQVYGERRVATLKPIQSAVLQLGLPTKRVRKLNGIMNALEMQIEDGGDSPQVNSLLVEAQQAAVIHQVGEEQAKPVLAAGAGFVQAEVRRQRPAV